jgi:hypothetical protein
MKKTSVFLRFAGAAMGTAIVTTCAIALIFGDASSALAQTEEKGNPPPVGTPEIRIGLFGNKKVDAPKVLGAFNSEVLGTSYTLTRTRGFANGSRNKPRTSAQGWITGQQGQESVVTAMMVTTTTTNAEIAQNALGEISVIGSVTPTNASEALGLISNLAANLPAAKWTQNTAITRTYEFTSSGNLTIGDKSVQYNAVGRVLTMRNGKTVVSLRVGTGALATEVKPLKPPHPIRPKGINRLGRL